MNRKIFKYSLLGLLGAALACAAMLMPERRGGDYIAAGSPEERAALFAGEDMAEAKLIAAHDITIPKSEDKIYEKYIALQKMQALPLEYFLGERGILYTYDTGAGKMRAELLVCDGRLIAAGVYEYLSGSSYSPFFQQNIPKSD